MENKVIGVDLDSTLIKMTVCGKAAKELGYDYTDVDVIDWYQSNFPDDMKKRMLELFLDPVVMCDQAEPIEGSQATIKLWTEMGYKVVLITARGPALHEPTMSMVNKFYPEIGAENIHFVNFNESKLDKMISLGIGVWVDDAPHGAIDALSLHIPTVLVSNKFTKYNWKIKHHPKLLTVVKKIEDITDEQLVLGISGAELIARERNEHVTKHGRTPEYDFLENKNGELLAAAHELLHDAPRIERLPRNWDRKICMRMIGKTHIDRLVVSGSFLAAEVDRLKMAELKARRTLLKLDK